MAEKLTIGDSFPTLDVPRVDGGVMHLPDGLGGKYNIVLFFRGHW